jgi:hypothetical protein
MCHTLQSVARLVNALRQLGGQPIPRAPVDAPFPLVSAAMPWQRVSMRFHPWLVPTALLALLGAGCATPNGSEIRPLTDRELSPFFARAKDPRQFWITVYRSDQGPVFAGTHRLHPDQLTRLPFQPEQTPVLLFQSAAEASLPLVKFDANRGNSYLALIDTSSAHNWLSFHTAQEIGVTPLGPPAYDTAPVHVQDNVRGFASVASTLRFDRLYVETAIVYARAAHGPMGLLARRPEKPWPELVVGVELLKALPFFQLDYPNRLAILSSTAVYAPDPNFLVATVPLRDVQGAFAAQGSLNGENRIFILDSAGDFEVAMANPPTNDLRQVSVGDLVFRQVKAVSMKSQGLGLSKYPRIGRQLLSRFKVTFAPAARKVHFEKPGGAKR